MSEFDPRQYWEKRLADNYGLNAVGYWSMGTNFNRWMYRVRKAVFLKIVRSLKINLREASVLDIGSGTGFYIDLWKKLDVESITGVDITSVAVRELSEKFSDASFHQMDVGDDISALQNNKYDAVSAMDVLFHIVDDEKYLKSIENIYSLLKPNGYFIYSDNFLHSDRVESSHQVSRSLFEIEKVLTNRGFEIVGRKPMFVLMNFPVDSKNALFKRMWYRMERIVSKSELIGFIAGALLFPLERILVSVCKESTTTECMIARKPE
ncbi:MAG: class I SAM-dependent methyltransferase [bacterium]